MGSGTRAGRRILLVEDHAGTLSALTWLLEHQGFGVDAASSLSAATDLAAAHDYDLLVCDIGLPDGSGCDLMASLRRRGATRGIGLSGFTDDATVSAARAAGFARFLDKPVAFPDLLKAIDDVLSDGSAGNPVLPAGASTAAPPIPFARM